MDLDSIILLFAPYAEDIIRYADRYLCTLIYDYRNGQKDWKH